MPSKRILLISTELAASGMPSPYANLKATCLHAGICEKRLGAYAQTRTWQLAVEGEREHVEALDASTRFCLVESRGGV